MPAATNLTAAAAAAAAAAAEAAAAAATKNPTLSRCHNHKQHLGKQQPHLQRPRHAKTRQPSCRDNTNDQLQRNSKLGATAAATLNAQSRTTTILGQQQLQPQHHHTTSKHHKQLTTATPPHPPPLPPLPKRHNNSQRSRAHPRRRA